MDTSAPDTDDSPFKRILNFFGINRAPDTTEDIEQEIQGLLDDGEEQGLITREEGEMISSILEFRDTLVREIMTPRSDMVSAEAKVSAAELIQLITDEGYTRIPIYQDSPDNIIGILHAKDLLPFCLNAATMPAASELVKPAFFVLDTRKIVNLLKDFQSQKGHLAVVTDEFGSVRGLVTLEDVLEEIVGEIRDEYDKAEKRWKVVNKDMLLTDAKVNLEEVEDFFGISLPEGPYESVGGLIIHQLDRVPPVGATMLINSLVFEVVSADRRRIHTVKIQNKLD
ncbi:MAG: HlyC/CorC family transporter [Desulfurivibrio sp.]|nr:HlyC/CorC family transporter [Desulfurivibrio sp.]MBU4119351.1 hemolysin family protein [Pseudomonadota bacterium]